MNTDQIMKLSLKLANLKRVPADSGVYFPGHAIKSVLFCIDAGTAELLLARDIGCDAVIAHHPAAGSPLVNFPEVFKRQIHQMQSFGVPRKAAHEAAKKRHEQLEVDSHARNYAQTADAARSLKMPFMNIHTPLDEIGRRIMQEKVDGIKTKDCKIRDVIDTLYSIPEFRKARTRIEIRKGKPEDPAGKVVVSHGAGTNGGWQIAQTYFDHGFDTVIYIHVSPADLDKLRTGTKGNLIVTGHIASDSVGINPFIHELEKRNVTVRKIGIVPD